MDDISVVGAAAGLAAMQIHTVTLHALIAKGIVTPDQIREILDGQLMLFETLEGQETDLVQKQVLRVQQSLVGDMMTALGLQPPPRDQASS